MECPDCGGDMWDNRPKKSTGEFSAKSPDFKCKDKECGGVIWPERKNGGKFVRANPPPEKRSNGGGAMSKDDYWARKEDFDREKEARHIAQQPRIERMNAQRNMLMYFAMRSELLNACKTPKEAADLMREMTNHFQRDIGRSPERKTESVVESEDHPMSGSDHPDDAADKNAFGEPDF